MYMLLKFVCFLLDDSLAPEAYMPRYLPAYEDGTDTVLPNVDM
jgi:hypothetical protein